MRLEQELSNSFLNAVIKTRKSWNNDKQFKKIVEKMEKGKNLKRKEFEKVYSMLREQGQYH
jgi:hypothetical protein